MSILQVPTGVNSPELYVSGGMRQAALNAALRDADNRLAGLHQRVIATENTREFARLALEASVIAQDMFAFEEEMMTLITPVTPVTELKQDTGLNDPMLNTQ